MKRLTGTETRVGGDGGGSDYLTIPLVPGDRLVFVGAALVRVNRGAARVLNFELRPRTDQAFYALYSPFWDSALEISSVGFVAGTELTIRSLWKGSVGRQGDGVHTRFGDLGVKVVGGAASLLPPRLLSRLLQVPGSRHRGLHHQTQEQLQQLGHRSASGGGSSSHMKVQLDAVSGEVSLSGTLLSGFRFLQLPYFCSPVAMSDHSDGDIGRGDMGGRGMEVKGGLKHKETGSIALQRAGSSHGLQKIVVPAHWSRALEACSTSHSLAICGGKGVGKSTFSRFVINGILSRRPGASVLYLDTDLGQGEVSPPGMVSLSRLSVPLLGPSFTHMAPHCSKGGIATTESPSNAIVYSVYLGDASPRNDPEGYVAAVSHVLEKARQIIAATKEAKGTEQPVLVINTCGWVTGMGLEMLLQILRDAEPNDVVEIQGRGKAREINLAVAFTRSSSASSSSSGSNSNSSYGKGSVDRTNGSVEKLPFALHSVQAWTASMPKALASPADLRALRLETYLEQHVLGLHTLQASLSLAARVARTRPFAVSFSSIALCVLGSSSTAMSAADVLMAMNGSIVGLCVDENLVLEDDDGSTVKGNAANTAPGMEQVPLKRLPAILPFTPLCCCVGIGVVRSINAERGELYILGPTALRSALPKVNLVMYGSLEAGGGLPLPPSFWFDEGSHKPAPYASWSKDTLSKRGGVGTELRGRGVLKRRRLEVDGRR